MLESCYLIVTGVSGSVKVIGNKWISVVDIGPDDSEPPMK
jgi:hypothetical protein